MYWGKNLSYATDKRFLITMSVVGFLMYELEKELRDFIQSIQTVFTGCELGR